MRLHLVLLAAAAVVLAASPASSQTPAPNPLEDGVWALQFRITENFTLSTFSGTVLSVKRHYSPRAALRAGISLNVSGADYDDSFEDPDTTFAEEGDREMHEVGLAIQYLRYLRPASRVAFFWGVGPAASYSRRTSMDSRGDDRYETTVSSWSIGAGVNLGVEWFAARDVGLHAEYGLEAGYRSLHGDYTRSEGIDASRDSDQTSWNVSGESVRFGASVYF